MSAYRCACGAPSNEPGRPCPSCATRARGPAPRPAFTPTPAGRFVPAPRIELARPRRCDPLPPITLRSLEESDGPVRGAITSTAGLCPACQKEPPARVWASKASVFPREALDMCGNCRGNYFNRVRRRALSEQRASVKPVAHSHERASVALYAAGREAALRLAAHHGSRHAACRAAGINSTAIHDLIGRGHAGAYVCRKLVEAATNLPTRAA